MPQVQVKSEFWSIDDHDRELKLKCICRSVSIFIETKQADQEQNSNHTAE